MAIGIGLVAFVLAIVAIITVPLVRYVRVWIIFNKFHGPPAIPLLGNTHQFKQDPNELVEQVNNWVEDYRSKSKGLMRLWLGPFPCLFIYNPQYAEQILSSSRHIKKGFVYTFLEPWLGLGLLTSTGEKWFHRRKMLTPTFHFAILNSFIEVFDEQSKILCRKFDEIAQKEEPVNVCPLVTLCVLDVICETAMGKQLNAQEESNNDYVNAVIRMSDVIQERQKKPWFWPDPLFDNTKSGKEHSECLRILHKMTNTLIDERSNEAKGRVDGNDNDGPKKRIAFLDLLLKMQQDDPSFTKSDIREEVDTFMFEGHDTTAALASWALFLIGHHTKVQKKLHQEVDSVFGDSDRAVTADDLQKLPYLSCALKESLRIFPSVPIIGRDLEEDCTIDGKTVPKGTLLIIAIGSLHRDPTQFPDPLVFDPDRFLPEVSSKRHPFSYVPFSAGPRNCIGQRFALMEEKVLVANILRRFSLESTQSLKDTMPIAELILRPSEGIILKITHRK
ncbi:cytochrome P450 4V2-like [Lytechinus variegatus]|uniref:cytochrome P450 4V2-like n=1 Tax=Lytechinus variegatus TaxID=7654 RepID=UPI001BB15648|nr:cytochrome P450 4V2-like [Lytechinus variegatus]XP_041485745.1 cytochrome P450 4V2-like [Lytechinus variegatus]XP_041485746.1 cytochrome P450 4V2-like [Lytechinus variegatus]